MKIVIPDDYQDMVDQLPCFSLIRHHDVKRYREPARDLDQLVDRLKDADVVVSIRERVEFSRELLQRMPKLKLLALVGRNSQMIDFAAATELGIPVSTTHTITGCIIGVGAARRVSAVRWKVANNIVVAWIITIPASAFMAALAYAVVGVLE